MAERSSNEIVCEQCGKDALVRKEPVFDGFTKVGEQFVCLSCGHVYPDEASTPFKAARRDPTLFTESDKDPKVDLFEDNEKKRFCRYCEFYTVNPFVQRCDKHDKEVEATDICVSFKRKPEDEIEDAGESPSLSDLF